MHFRDLAESLLYEEESPTLDFKRKQYLFEGASDAEKSELLKDILAFANAWRRTDAFIYLGAEEVKGGRSTVVGILEHIDDAKLQQFVNSKTNRPIDFSYVSIEKDGLQVALIYIPVQQRPTYLLKDYGRLQRSTVYVRRGSSTDTASPDEIARMGMASIASPERAPKLSAFLVAGAHGEIIDKSITVNTANVEIPDASEFPLYGVQYRDAGLGFRIAPLSDMYNHDYHSEYANWYKTIQRFKGVHLCVKNTGSSVARDVKVVITIKKANADIEVCEQDDLPRKPSTMTHGLSPHMMRGVTDRPDILCKPTLDGWRVVSEMGKVQAMETVISRDLLCVGANKPIDILMTVEIFSDDLSHPVTEQLSLRLEVVDQKLSVSDFVRSGDNARDS